MATSIEHLKSVSIEVCTHESCPLHPKSENQHGNNIYNRTKICSHEYEINMVCVFCEHAERVDMEEMVKRTILKSKLRKNGN